MKKLMIAGIACAIILQLVVLSFLLKKPEIESSTKETIVQTNVNVTGYTTDFTEVIEDSRSKMVTVKSADIIYSGVIYDYVDDNAIIVTKILNHEEAAIQVTFDNEVTSEAKVIGIDENNDILVLEVPTGGVVAKPFNKGDSDLLKQGAFVIAIGRSSGLGSKGASYVGTINNAKEYDEKTAAGNSSIMVSELIVGGAIINSAGDLVGLANTESVGNSADSKFTLINEIKVIVETLLEKGTISNLSMGIDLVEIRDITTYQKAYLNINIDTLVGLYIENVEEESIAFMNGLIVGDIIMAINDISVDSIYDYQRVMYGTAIGDKITIKYDRRGEEAILSFVYE